MKAQLHWWRFEPNLRKIWSYCSRIYLVSFLLGPEAIFSQHTSMPSLFAYAYHDIYNLKVSQKNYTFLSMVFQELKNSSSIGSMFPKIITLCWTCHSDLMYVMIWLQKGGSNNGKSSGINLYIAYPCLGFDSKCSLPSFSKCFAQGR